MPLEINGPYGRAVSVRVFQDQPPLRLGVAGGGSLSVAMRVDLLPDPSIGEVIGFATVLGVGARLQSSTGLTYGSTTVIGEAFRLQSGAGAASGASDASGEGQRLQSGAGASVGASAGVGVGSRLQSSAGSAAGSSTVSGVPLLPVAYAIRLDMYDASTLFSDVAGTTLAAVDTAVARVSDKSLGLPLRNRLPNNKNTGAVLGVVGSGGAFPTGWDTSASLTREIVGIGTSGGVPYFDLRLTGALSGGFFINTSQPNAVPAADGQTWVASTSFQIIANVSGVSGVALVPSTRLANGTLKHVYPDVQMAFPAEFTRFATPATTLSNADGSAGDVAFILGYLRLQCTGTVDITLRIGGTQSEQASAASGLQIVPANNATQSVVADRPVRRTVGDLTYLDFNGINHFMNVAPDPTWRLSSLSVFIPVRTTASAGVLMSRVGATNAYFALINDSNTNVADINAGTITYYVNGTAHPGINRQQLHGLIATGAWVILECAGVNLAGSNWADGMRINGLNNTAFMADADIGAVRFVPTSEIAANRAEITAELADKFGVTL